MDTEPSVPTSGGPPPAHGSLRDWWAGRDPGLRATKRSVRAAVLVPAVFAMAQFGVGDPQTSLFAVFGSVALLLFVDFAGPAPSRIRSYGGLWAVGAVLITVATLCSTHAVLAVVAMGAVGFAVLFAGIVTPRAVTGSTALLLTFVLPVAEPAPASAIGHRLLGWALAGAVCIPAALVVWTERWHDRLRLRLADAADAVAGLLDALSTPATAADCDGARHRMEGALQALRAQYEATPYRPTGAGTTDVALTNLVSQLEWVGARAGDIRPATTPSALVAVGGRRGDGGGRGAPPGCRPRPGRGLRVGHRRVGGAGRRGRTAGGRPGGGHRRRPGRSRGRTRAPGVAVGGCRRRPPGGLGPRHRSDHSGPDGGVRRQRTWPMSPSPHWARRGDASAPQRWSETVRSYARVAAGHLGPGSVWFRNSVRGAVALAVAVAVVETTTVQHGFWVVLGTLSVLRSNALGTGSTAVRAVVGTALGFVVGSVVLVVLGHHDALLWAVLPVAVLVAGVAPSAISFVAGQAGFTVMVVVIFNIIVPVGSSVGLVRVVDVAIGTMVSVVVGLLFWPRGAAAELARALTQGYVAATAWLVAAIDQVGREGPAGRGSPERTRAMAAARRLDDAYRQFLSERGAKQVPLPTVTGLLTGCGSIRLTARTLEGLPVLAGPGAPPPIHEVVVARTAVTESCRSMERWFCDVARNLDDPPHVPDPPAPGDARLPRELVDAWSAVRRAGTRQGVFAVLRLLWVADRLDGLRHLQVELAGTASLLP